MSSLSVVLGDVVMYLVMGWLLMRELLQPNKKTVLIWASDSLQFFKLIWQELHISQYLTEYVSLIQAVLTFNLMSNIFVRF